MTEGVSIPGLIAFFVVGLITGWGYLVIRADIRIQKDNTWRRVRAVYLAAFCIAFVVTLVFTNGLGFLVFLLGCGSALAYAALRKK